MLFQSLRAEDESVALYLAGASRLEACIQEALNNEDETLEAWQDSLGYSLAVAESSICPQFGIWPPPDCLRAQQWAAEARELIASHEGDAP